MSFVLQNKFSPLTSFLAHFHTYVSVTPCKTPSQQQYSATPEGYVSFREGKSPSWMPCRNIYFLFTSFFLIFHAPICTRTLE